jgi:hypothetical protein
MTTRRAVRRPVKSLAPKPEPEDVRMKKKAHNLPMFGPGIVITVPLGLWPEYKALYQLEPQGIREPKLQPKDGPGEAILLVKRTLKDSK